MSTSHTTAPATSSSGGGGIEESDVRSQLFASQRKTMQPGSLGSRPTSTALNPLSPFESRTQPASAFPSKTSSSASKAPVNQQTTPATTVDATLAVTSPIVADGGCAMAGASSSMDNLLEELSRRKTHNVSHARTLISMRL